MGKRNVRVLITGVGSTTAVSAIKGLRKQGTFNTFVVGADLNDGNNIAGAAFCDNFYRIPPASEGKAYIDRLLDVIRGESIDLLIPIVDSELEVLSRYGDVVARSTYLLLSSYDTVMTCNDKMRTFHLFTRLGVPTLKTVLVEDRASVKKLMREHGVDFPFVAKPRKGVSSRGVYEIRTWDELCLLDRIEEPIIQEKGYGREYTIDAFCDDGQLLAAVPRERMEIRSGISYKGQTVRSDILVDYTRTIVESLGIRGPANIQCFFDGKNVRFFEVNPRFSGSLPLTIASGVNTPLLALQVALGEKPETLTHFKIVKMCRYWDEVFYEK